MRKMHLIVYRLSTSLTLFSCSSVGARSTVADVCAQNLFGNKYQFKRQSTRFSSIVEIQI